MKDREIIILLLQIIKFNGDINHLLKFVSIIS